LSAAAAHHRRAALQAALISDGSVKTTYPSLSSSSDKVYQNSQFYTPLAAHAGTASLGLGEITSGITIAIDGQMDSELHKKHTTRVVTRDQGARAPVHQPPAAAVCSLDQLRSSQRRDYRKGSS
jgi:hypothetical protein